LDNREKWGQRHAKRVQPSRARLLKNRTCDEGQPGCHGKYFAHNGRMTTCPNPACRAARRLRRERQRYADNLETARAKLRVKASLGNFE
jgi:hypothetical protein